MNIIIYDGLTGKFLRTLMTIGDPAEQLLPGEKYIEITTDGSFQYIENGRAVEVPSRPTELGEFYSFNWITKKWILDTAALERFARTRRNQLLASTDWTQVLDVDADTRQKFAEYRQLLRDVPQQPGFPETIVWPTPPAK